jgi:hypothetical protein
MHAVTHLEKWPLSFIYAVHWEEGHRPGGPCSFENQPTTGTTLLCMAAAEVNQHKAAHAESSTPLAESQYRDILNEYGPLLIFT